ncbi:PREDICTED: uncharacterized protein LOC105448375 [Wasmannia auropunctata]|uniref:uncharacterized protein LOC105448375 n=1 Tax=Wasmannia auropunctata TaxID=64793 RepID=UPI0005F03011|nr:PREDICTED: uncharacterized protein LOC105448375 [Wasmannia auropunctata]
MCNRCDIKDIIFNKLSYNDKSVSANESALTDSSNWNEISANISSDNNIQENFLVISVLREDFTNLLKHKVYNRRVNGKTYYRLRNVLEPGKWQEVITDKFWQTTHLKCAFQFKNHYISEDAKSGVINERAHVLMKEGDPVPPHLYSNAVLHTAKSETAMTDYVNPDVFKALVILKFSSLQNIIHNIGLDPFFIHYWSNHQLNVYKKYTVENNACLFVDATGSIVQKLYKADGSFSKHLFLYICAINCKSGQFSICQMIKWIRSGAPTPKEVVCDALKALLIGIIRAFTNYSNIEDYADSSLSETDGNLENGNPTQCDEARTKLVNLMTTDELQLENFETDDSAQYEIENEINEIDNIINPFENSWTTWGKEILSDVESSIKSNEGNRINPHYYPKLIDRLMIDIRSLPLWTNICTDKFGYGRIPASSASVERQGDKQSTAKITRSCGSYGGLHPRAKCKFFEAVCHNCKKKGHIAKVCRAVKQIQGPAESTNQDTADTQTTTRVDAIQRLDKLNKINKLDSSSKRMLRIQIDGRDLEMELDTGAPCVPLALRDAYAKEIDANKIASGFYERIEHSVWASTTHIVMKKNGKLRITGNYKPTLNPRIVIDEYPIPRPEYLFNNMKGAKLFCHLYNFDNLIFSLDAILQRLRNNCLKLNRDKCIVATTTVEFLGHKIDAQGIHKSDKHIQAIRDAPKPSSPEELHLFLGKATYYGSFIANLSSRSRPLRDILHTQPLDNGSRSSIQRHKKCINVASSVNAIQLTIATDSSNRR